VSWLPQSQSMSTSESSSHSPPPHAPDPPPPLPCRSSPAGGSRSASLCTRPVAAGQRCCGASPSRTPGLPVRRGAQGSAPDKGAKQRPRKRGPKQAAQSAPQRRLRVRCGLGLSPEIRRWDRWGGACAPRSSAESRGEEGSTKGGAARESARTGRARRSCASFVRAATARFADVLAQATLPSAFSTRTLVIHDKASTEQRNGQVTP